MSDANPSGVEAPDDHRPPRSDGRVVGRYEIISEVGRGGMATVYLARQRDLDRLVALKELSAFHAGSKEFAERFLRESRLAGSLSHPNIVTVHEYFEDRGIPHIAMEYVPAGSLRPWVGRLTLPQLAGVLEGVLAGLAHAEGTGIVHRDLKPENLMITAEGRIKIADFGIAKATQGAGTAAFMTATGMTVGTPTYMAPEQAMGQQIGPWTDLYSVGVMAHEQIVGKAPFIDSDAPMVILMRHVNERIPSVIELRPQVDPALSEWVDQLLQKNPERRTRSAVQAWEELEEIILRLLGARWRREARLPEQGPLPDNPSPLTPAPFESQSVRTPTDIRAPSESGFVTFGAPATTDEPQPRSAPSERDVTDDPEAQPTPKPTPDQAPAAERVDQPDGAAQTPRDAPAERQSERTPSPPPQSVPNEELTAPPREALRPPAAAAAPAEAPSRAAKRPVPAPVEAPPPRGADAPPAEPRQAKGRASRRSRIPALGGAAALAAAAIGFAVSSPGSGTTHAATIAPLSGSAEAGTLAVKIPAGWQKLSTVPPTSGVTLSGALAVQSSATGAELTVGGASPADATLLPASLLGTLPARPDGETIGLGRFQALRYTNLGSAKTTAYAIPTSAGVMLALCVPPVTAPSSQIAECERILATLRPGTATPEALGPSRSYAARASAAMAQLNSASASAEADLHRARTPKGQAAAAARLAGAYRAAASALGGARPGAIAQAANQALVSALTRGQAGFAALATAARANDRAAYERARATLPTTLGAITRAFGELVRAGYSRG